jgi:hypothetical protein
MMKTRSVAVAVGSALLCTLLVVAPSPDNSRKVFGADEQDVTARTQIAKRIEEDYARLVSGLRYQLRQLQRLNEQPFAPHPDVVLSGTVVLGNWGERITLSTQLSAEEDAIIRTAGTIRADSCAHLLLNRITCQNRVLINAASMVRCRQHSPAFEALCEIGSPGCNAALTRLPQESDELTRVFIVGLLQTCLGDAKANAALKSILSRTTDAIERQRIEEGIAQIEEGPCPDSLRRYYHARKAGATEQQR